MPKLIVTKLAAGLLATGFAFACTSVLDTDELTKSWTPKKDGALVIDSKANKDSNVVPKDGPIIPKDTGGCIQGKSCTVSGLKGQCSYGTSVCNDSGTGICVKKFAPVTEQCNGIKTAHDQDCDGIKDNADPDAHKACGTGKYCTGTACATGCWTKSHCTSPTTNLCVNHVCRCGTSSSNRTCGQPNPLCVNAECRCDADSRCRSYETCKSGVCFCGAAAGKSAGSFCPSPGVCDPTTGSCTGLPDAGPPDQSIPTPDQAVPDQAAPSPDQAVSSDQATPQPDQ